MPKLMGRGANGGRFSCWWCDVTIAMDADVVGSWHMARSLNWVNVGGFAVCPKHTPLQSDVRSEIPHVSWGAIPD